MLHTRYGESLSSPYPKVPEYDPYQWLALSILRFTLTPPVRTAGIRKGLLARWAQNRVAWLKSDSGRFWVDAAGQSWEEIYERTIAMCKKLQVQWRGPEPVAGGVVLAGSKVPRPEVSEAPEVVEARKHRLVFLLRAQGRTIEEVALTVGVSRRQVHRVIRKGRP